MSEIEKLTFTGMDTWGKNEHNNGGIKLYWQAEYKEPTPIKGGWGEITIYSGKSGKHYIDTECMGEKGNMEFVMQLLKLMVEEAEVLG